MAAGNETPHVLMVLNDRAWFWSHRLPLAKGILARGWDLSVAVAGAQDDPGLREMGVNGIGLPQASRSANPFRHLGIVFALKRILKEKKPDIVHAITVRYALYAGVAARLAGYGRPVIFTVAGLGVLFTQGGGARLRLIRAMVRPLFKFAFGRPNATLIFQNPDDLDRMVESGIVRKEQTSLIRGSGVDLGEFPFTEEPESAQEEPVVLFSSRLIREKGLHDFVEAARRLKTKGVRAKFQVAGELCPDNPNAVTDSEMKTWQQDGILEWLGRRSDMPAILQSCTLMVLPSYYGEGVPKILLEAAATGRAIVTTDMPGCREAVADGENGILVPPKDTKSLAEAIESLLCAPERRREMGAAGRKRMERDFHTTAVVAATLNVYDCAQQERTQ